MEYNLLAFSQTNRKILSIAIPSILGNISIPLLGIVDTALVGHLDGEQYLAALGVASTLFTFLYWVFSFLRMGTTGSTAQALGQDNKPLANTYLIQNSKIAILIAITLLLISPLIKKTIPFLFSLQGEPLDLLLSYFEIRIWAAPATLMIYVLHGWVLGHRNSLFPMLVLLFTNILNFALSYLFTYTFSLQSDGIAWGTLCAQYSTMFLYLFYVKKKYDFRFFPTQNPVEKVALPWSSFTQTNIPIFIRTFFLLLVLSFFMRFASQLGTEILAATTILYQIWLISSYGIDGFANAAEVLSGTYKGSQNHKLFTTTIQHCLLWGLGLSFLLSLLLFLFQTPIFRLFSDQPIVLETLPLFSIWIVIAPICNFICFLWDGVFLGMTETKAMQNTTILSSLIFFICFFILPPSAHTLWLSLTLFMVFRGLSLSWCYHKNKKKWFPLI